MSKYLVLLILVFACKTSISTSDSISLGDLAKKYVGENYSSNERGAYTLVASSPKFAGDSSLKFIVFETASGNIIYGPESLMGEVSWYADKELLVRETPEVIQDKNSMEDFRKILNIETGQKRNINPNK